jgi:hypothetical protein
MDNKEKKPFYKRPWFIVLAVIVALAIIGGASGGKKSTGSSSSAADASAAPVFVEVSAAALYKDFEDNQVSADAKWKGKPVKVSGVVTGIGKDVLGTAYVSLAVSDNEYDIKCVQCFFDDSKDDKLATLKKGQAVKINGECESLMLGVNLKVDNCDL